MRPGILTAVTSTTSPRWSVTSTASTTTHSAERNRQRSAPYAASAWRVKPPRTCCQTSPSTGMSSGPGSSTASPERQAWASWIRQGAGVADRVPWHAEPRGAASSPAHRGQQGLPLEAVSPATGFSGLSAIGAPVLGAVPARAPGGMGVEERGAAVAEAESAAAIGGAAVLAAGAGGANAPTGRAGLGVGIPVDRRLGVARALTTAVLAGEELASRPLGDGDHGVAPASAVDAGKTVELVVAEVLEEQAINPARPDGGI